MTNLMHRYFAPSGSDKWFNCPLAASGEARIAEQWDEEPASACMQEGTDAHAKLEQVLKAPNPLSELMSDRYTQEERDYLLPCVQAVCEDMDMLEAELLVEETIQSKIDSRLGGTPDAIVYSLIERILVVTDYKHGVRVFVPADTLQLQIYGHLVAAKLGPENFDTIILRVVQPRYYGGSEPVREHRIEDVPFWYHDFKRKLINAINKSDAQDPQPVTGDHCKWCKVACSKRMSDIEEVLGVDIKALDPEAEKDLGMLCMILDSEKSIKATIKQAKALATRFIEAGFHIRGYGLKASLGDREWVPDSDDNIARALRRKGLEKAFVWVKKLISPAQAEKKCDLDEKFFSRYVTRKLKGARLTKMKTGESSAETTKEKLEKYEMTEDEKALLESF